MLSFYILWQEPSAVRRRFRVKHVQRYEHPVEAYIHGLPLELPVLVLTLPPITGAIILLIESVRRHPKGIRIGALTAHTNTPIN
jgi:hypothetical protein